jgi:hypothetical protein
MNTTVPSLCVSLIVLILAVTTFCEPSKLRAVAINASQSTTATTMSITSLDCPAHCLNVDSKDKLPGARIFYLIVVHNNRTLHDALHLIRAVRDPRNILAVHVDQKAQTLIQNHHNNSNYESILHKELGQCSCGSKYNIGSEYDVKWGEWSMNLPTLWGMQLAVNHYAGQWDVFINLSGDTLPVYKTHVMANILQQLPYNFVTSSSCETGVRPTNVYLFPKWWHKRAHYTHQDTLDDPYFEYYSDETTTTTTTTKTRVKHNITLQTYFGSQWMILQAEFCTWIVKELEKPKSLPSQYRDYLVSMAFLMTDETFFSSLLEQVELFQHTLPVVNEDQYLLWKNQTASFISAVRYERMDEHTPSAFGYYPTQQRYQVANTTDNNNNNNNNNPLVEQTRPWGPYFLGVYDLSSIRASGALFVRKVSTLIDHNMVQLLPVERSSDIPDISWPEQVSISDKPDWERRIKERMLAKQQEAQEDLKRKDNDSDSEHEDDDEEL